MAVSTWSGLVLAHWSGSSAPAIVDDDGVLTGSEMLALAAGASRLFDELGYEPGEAIPVLMDESRDTIAMVVGGGLSRRPVAPKRYRDRG